MRETSVRALAPGSSRVMHPRRFEAKEASTEGGVPNTCQMRQRQPDAIAGAHAFRPTRTDLSTVDELAPRLSLKLSQRQAPSPAERRVRPA